MTATLGVDWSGAADAGRKIAAARLVWTGARARLDWLTRPFGKAGPAEVAAKFAGWLDSTAVAVAGLDFCFDLAAESMPAGAPRTGPRDLGRFVADHYPTPERFRDAAKPERRRLTDRLTSAPFAPTNWRMYRQTYWGLRALADTNWPVPPWDAPGPRTLVEILPAAVARGLVGRRAYKGKTAAALAGRAALLAALGGRYGLAPDAAAREGLLSDAGGDSIDAVLGAVAAWHALRSGFATGVDDLNGEGWIYAPPVGESPGMSGPGL